MEFVKSSSRATWSVVFCLIGAISPALAADTAYTATIDHTGKVLKQSPRWIKVVDVSAHPNYFSDYKVKFMPGLFNQPPGFCSVSVVDTSSNDRIYYGHAKLGGLPTTDHLKVLTLNVGDNKPSGNSSMDFMLMCQR